MNSVRIILKINIANQSKDKAILPMGIDNFKNGKARDFNGQVC